MSPDRSRPRAALDRPVRAAASSTPSGADGVARRGVRRRRVAGAALAVGALAMLGLAVPTSSQAAVVLPMESVYQETLYGEALSVGNGNLRCPTAADGVNLRAGTSFEACAQAQTGGVAASTLTNNNDYSMRQNDTDGRIDTFNHSSARFTIPAGASVRYAELNWGGNTGEFKTAAGTTSQYRSCNVVGQQYVGAFPTTAPPAPAADSPTQQSPGLQIGGGPRTEVTPHVTLDGGSGWPNNSERFYTGWSDVTETLRAADLSGDVTVTVSNVWAPSGVNCTAGWGLTVVWGFDAPVPGVIEYQNAIDIFRGHVRQGAAEAATSVEVSGFEAVSSANRVGLVAYEGDRGSVGDRFSINGVDVPEPTGYGALSDFFVSAAAGSSDPAWPVNFSADVNVFSTPLIPAGSTSATLGFRTNGDGFWMQSLWLEAAVPSVEIVKSADIALGRPGDPVTWTITVTNPSPATLLDIAVSDPQEPSCDRVVPSSDLVADSYTYTCAGTLPDTTVTNTATVTARTELGTELSASGRATVEVMHPALSVTKTADRALYLGGEEARFAVTVTNTGDVPVMDVEVRDEAVPACSTTLAALAPGESRTTTCAAATPLVGDVNTATATGLDPLGGPVGATATVPVPLAVPALDIDKSADAVEARPGDEVAFTVTATNTGSVRIDDVVVTDARVPDCSSAVESLAPGEAVVTTCTWTATTPQTFVNTATVTGTPMRCTGAEEPGSCTQGLGVPALTAHDEVVVTVLGTEDTSDGDVPGAVPGGGAGDGTTVATGAPGAGGTDPAEPRAGNGRMLAWTGSSAGLAVAAAAGIGLLLAGAAMRLRPWGRH